MLYTYGDGGSKKPTESNNKSNSKSPQKCVKILFNAYMTFVSISLVSDVIRNLEILYSFSLQLLNQPKMK